LRFSWREEIYVFYVQTLNRLSSLQHYIEFSHQSSEAAAQEVCDQLKAAVLLQVFQQERFKLL
jgi:hypothetical protein